MSNTIRKGEIILGLDISTSITGATIIYNGRIVESCFWDTRNKKKFPSLYSKADKIRENLAKFQEKYHISEIFIEQSLHSFRSGFSSAQTLSTLSRFNGIVSWLCYKLFNVEPVMIAATSARKQAGVSIKRGDNAKQKVVQFIVDNYPEIKISYTRHGNPKPGMYDMCDSIIVALAGYKIVSETSNS
tara:strand:- start:9608 stop:10168 length:561 start_codon:yes stop_codon:yes gene_type:complete